MFDDQISGQAAAVLRRLHDVLDEATALPLHELPDPELLGLWTAVESCKRRFAPIDHAIIVEVQARQLAPVFGAKSTVV